MCVSTVILSRFVWKKRIMRVGERKVRKTLIEYMTTSVETSPARKTGDEAAPAIRRTPFCMSAAPRWRRTGAGPGIQGHVGHDAGPRKTGLGADHEQGPPEDRDEASAPEWPCLEVLSARMAFSVRPHGFDGRKGIAQQKPLHDGQRCRSTPWSACRLDLGSRMTCIALATPRSPCRCPAMEKA